MNVLIRIFFLLGMGTVSVQAQNIGIGTTTPINGRLVVRGTVGAVSALFGDNTTGVSIENSFPGIGLNTYFNGTRKYISAGFGGLLGLNPSTGDMYLMNTAVTGTADANATILTRLFINGSNGQLGIGTTSTSGKLTVEADGNTNGIAVSSNSGTTNAIRAENFSPGGANNAILAYSQNGTAISASTLGTGAAAVNASAGSTGFAIKTSGRSQFSGAVGINLAPTTTELVGIDATGYDDGISIYSNNSTSTSIRAENFSASGPGFAILAYSQNGGAITASCASGGTAVNASNVLGSGLALRTAGRSQFNGNVDIIGTLSKSAGTFKIDHPLDPANRYLIHSFVESPDMLNVYNGTVTTDAAGMAVAELPAYFEAANMEFKYQLTIIGKTFARVLVYEEISGNRFVIKTDLPSIKVSWQVTGIRNDAYARKNRVIPEVDKSETEKGKYLTPLLFNQPKEKGIGYKE